MFSRTTMASSISRPMHSDSAISVMKLSEKPNAYSAMNVAITEIGSVRPVMTVLAPRVQEQEHDQDREQRAFDDRLLDAVERAFDPLRVRPQRADLDVLGQAALQLCDRLLDAGADLRPCSPAGR